MILPMRKMDLLLYHREQENFLEKLRELGVVHITSEQAADSTATQTLTAEVQRIHRVAAALKKIQKEKKIPAATACSNVADLLKNFEECETKRDRIEQELAALAKDSATLAPWGQFDPQSVKRLAEAGINVKFYDAPPKKFDALDKSQLNMEIVARQDGLIYFVVVYRDGENVPELAGAEEVRLPDTSLNAIGAKIESLKAEREKIEKSIEGMAAYAPAVDTYYGERLNSLRFEEARGSMGAEVEGKVLKLSGWVPKKDEAKVAAFLNNFPAYATFRDPTADEAPPVQLKNAGTGFSKLFEPVLGLYSLPGYREMDVAPFVAPFFTVFFGLCLGDVGYGGLVVLVSLAGLILGGAKMKPIMTLGVILGLSTVVAGILLNSFFGAALFGDILAGEGRERFSLLAAENGQFPAMSLSFVAAFLQLFLGMGLQAYMRWRDVGFTAGLQPISSIFMVSGAVILGARDNILNLGINTFAVGPVEIGPHIVALGNSGPVGEILLYGGLGMLLLFNSLNKPIFIRPLTGLWALYNFASGILSNVLSYMRLFALGLAGGLLGAAVNTIAFMVAEAPAGPVLMVIVLIGGHAMNFGLSGLGAFIHPLRLTFVEFYGAVGFAGGGKPYVPFAKVER